MALRNLISIRGLHTTRCLLKSLLSDSYKSPKIWDERLKCPHLTNDKGLINSINDKIIMGSELNNIELDVFINIASPSTDDIAQLKESVIQLNKIRRSVEAATIIPSTHHSLCRLFLYSQCLPSLVHVLENRVDYGIFPDLFMLNILIDDALDKDNLVLASKLASLVMLQEEFGLNPLTDALSALSVVKYVNSKSDFSDWKDHNVDNDVIFRDESMQTDENVAKDESTKTKKEEEEEEDQDDAEYIRVPFLRNPYDDNHFDLKNGRLICGKILRTVGSSLSNQDKYLGDITALLGSILEGRWSDAITMNENLVKSQQSLPDGLKEVIRHHIENLHDIEGPTSDAKENLLASINLIQSHANLDIIDKLENTVRDNLLGQESVDKDELIRTFKLSSELRSKYQRRREETQMKDILLAQIQAKKKDLEAREQYLYFYDNLRKTTLTKIEYK